MIELAIFAAGWAFGVASRNLYVSVGDARDRLLARDSPETAEFEAAVMQWRNPARAARLRKYARAYREAVK